MKGKKVVIVLSIVAGVMALNLLAYTVFDPHSEAVSWAGKIFNFAVLAGAFIWGVPKILGKSYGAYFGEERESIRAQLTEAKARRRAAEERARAAEARLRAIDEEMLHLVLAARKDGGAEGARLLEKAESDAKGILEKAEREVERRADAAKRDLRRFTAERVAELAVHEAKRRLDDGARNRFFDRAAEALGEKIS